jgi:hypothetical protein
MATKEAASVNSRPARPAPVIRHVGALDGNPGRTPQVLAACILSALVNLGILGVVVGVNFLFPNWGVAQAPPPATERVITETKVEEEPKEEANLENEDLGMNPNLQTNYNLPRIEQFSVPGAVDPTAPIGIKDAPEAPPMNIPPPPGFGGSTGQGGGNEASVFGKGNPFGMAGGLGGKFIPGGFGGRSGATRKQVLEEGGGNGESEAAVARGLKWMTNHQAPDGHWSLDGFNVHGRCNCTGFGAKYDVAATAFGLLPLLGAGETHLGTGKNSAYAKNVKKGLDWLIAKQQANKDGSFSGNMYEHGLATIAICEAYGLTADNRLKGPAQAALNFIASAQSEAGGWRYGAKQPGFDTSVAGWQLMALKSGQMSGLSVPKETFSRADKWLDAAMDRNSYGYGYASAGAGVTTSAVGLLCREYRGWGPRTHQLLTGVEILKANPPGGLNMYYYYYATQVMHHLGGDYWKFWNEGLVKNKQTGKWEKVNPGMRDWLIAKQDTKDATKHSYGSWDPAGDVHGGAGGRIMITSMSLLTLEVYYRHLPLYRREGNVNKDEAARDLP